MIGQSICPLLQIVRGNGISKPFTVEAVSGWATAPRLSDADRHTMGQRGRELVAAKYQWEAVGRAMAGVYESVVERQGPVAG